MILAVVTLPFDIMNLARLEKFCGSALKVSVLVVVMGGCGQQEDKPKAVHVTCINNLKQIGLAVSLWAVDNNLMEPWNVSTNNGGTLELCEVDKDGFDTNAALHFQVMSNELNTPLILICPKDQSRKPAADFQSLRPANVSYRLRSGTNSSRANPREILAVCPVDGNVLYCDGTVKEVKEH